MILVTKEIARKLYKADREYLSGDNGELKDLPITVKFFNPCGPATWYINRATPLVETNGEPTEDVDAAKDWHMWGWRDLGMGPDCSEFGYVLLSELAAIRLKWGLRVERDRHYSGHTFAEVM